MTARVLVVDDTVANVKLLEAKLAVEYFDVVTAYNGEEAIQIATSNPPDIILLDIMMPVLDGWFVLAELAGRAKRPGVVVCSAKSSEVDRVRAKELSADEYVTKPFEPDDLVNIIREVLARRASARV